MLSKFVISGIHTDGRVDVVCEGRDPVVCCTVPQAEWLVDHQNTLFSAVEDLKKLNDDLLVKNEALGAALKKASLASYNQVMGITNAPSTGGDGLRSSAPGPTTPDSGSQTQPKPTV